MNKIREQGSHDDDGAYYGQHDHDDRPALSVVCHEWIPPHFGEGTCSNDSESPDTLFRKFNALPWRAVS